MLKEEPLEKKEEINVLKEVPLEKKEEINVLKEEPLEKKEEIKVLKEEPLEIKVNAPLLPQRSKASFDELISQQTATGYWKLSPTILSSFFTHGMPAVFPGVAAHITSDTIWHTLVALYILTEEFGDRESEWDLLA